MRELNSFLRCGVKKNIDFEHFVWYNIEDYLQERGNFMVEKVCKKYIKIIKYKFNKIIREVYYNMANIYLKIGITCRWASHGRN